jgi:hypothetical protein
MHRPRWIATLCALAALALASSASAATLAWEGQTWDITPNATAVVDGNGDAVLTRTLGTADASLHVNRVEPAPGGNSFINDNGTPWVLLGYEDNAQFRGVDLFVDSEVAPFSPRVQAGSLFSCEGFGFARYTAPPTTEEVVFTSGCGTRAAGAPHTIYIGQRPDGTVDYNFDGAWYTSTFLKTAVGPFDFNDVYLRLRGTDGSTAKFTRFAAGDDHPANKADCKDGASVGSGVFKNQGDCVSFMSNGK